MKRGEVVAFDYPFSDGSGSKVRPALVVSSDALPKRDVILAMISGTSSSTSFAIDLARSPPRASRSLGMFVATSRSRRIKVE